jgi:23S rRNA pseudouridine1911/1915/1917 synthase
MSETLRLPVPAHEGGARLDVFLARHVPDFSRARATEHIAQGHVRLWRGADHLAPGKVKPSYLLHDALTVEVSVQPRPQMSAEPEAIPLVVVYEDADLLVVDKPAGLVVHPAAGHETGTLVNALLHHVPDVAEVGDDDLRPGLVHRIDKDTSGLLVVSKSELAMRKLAALFARHELERRYAAVVLGTWPEDALTIRSLHGRHPTERKKFTGRVKEGKPAVTHVQVLARSPLASLVACTLETGRTHQIRVHLAERGHPIAGDALYGGQRPLAKTERTANDRKWLGQVTRQALHAYALGFAHPRTGQPMRFHSPWPAELVPVVEGLFGEVALPGLTGIGH